MLLINDILSLYIEIFYIFLDMTNIILILKNIFDNVANKILDKFPSVEIL